MAGTQEIGIKLKLDTSEAIRSAKQMEKAVQGIGEVKNAGELNGGRITSKQAEQVKKQAQQVEQVLKRHLQQVSSLQQQIAAKEAEIVKASQRMASKATIDQLQRQLGELQARYKVLNSQTGSMTEMANRARQYQTTVSTYKVGEGLGGFLRSGLGEAAGALGLTLSVGKIVGWLNQGMQMVKDQEAQMAMLGNRIPGYGSNYAQGRRDAGLVGAPMGFTSAQTISLADYYTSIAGARNPQDMWARTSELQREARAMGVDVFSLAGVQGTQAQMGSVTTTPQMQAFANLLAGAIADTQMQGRQQEFMDAVTTLAKQTASGQSNFTNQQLANTVGLLDVLGKISPMYRGEGGAQLAGQLDAGIKSGGQMLDLLMGWGTKYQGISGRANLLRAEAKGISDPNNLKTILTNLDRATGGNKDLEAIYLKDMFGFQTIDAADAILKNKNAILNGVSQAQLNKIISSGAAINSQNLSNYNNSAAGQRARNDAAWSNTLQAGGQFLDSVWRPLQSAFLAQPAIMQWGEMGLGAYGMWKGMGALGSGAGRFLSNRLGLGGSNPFANPTKWAKESQLSKVGNIASKAKTALKGIRGVGAAAEGAEAVGAAAEGAAGVDAALGLAGGIEAAGAAADATGVGLPVGLALAAVGGLVAGGAWLWSKFHGKKSAQPTAVTTDIQKIQDQGTDNIQQEAKNLELRQSLVSLEAKNISDFSKSLDELKQILSQSSPSGLLGFGTYSTTPGGPLASGGFWGSLWNGVKSLFGFGGGGGGSFQPTGSGIYASSNPFANQPLTGNPDHLTAASINAWIDKYAPKNSIMRGMGAAFMHAAKVTGLNPAYLVAHAAQETGWGTSAMVRGKYNWFGIGAFDNNPGAAYGYSSPAQGIIQGAAWIAQNFVNKGQNTLNKMEDKSHRYATDPNWSNAIAEIMSTAPGANSTVNVHVKVSGSIDGMKPEHSHIIAGAVAKHVQNSVDLSKTFKQGVGGNR